MASLETQRIIKRFPVIRHSLRARAKRLIGDLAKELSDVRPGHDGDNLKARADMIGELDRVRRIIDAAGPKPGESDDDERRADLVENLMTCCDRLEQMLADRKQAQQGAAGEGELEGAYTTGRRAELRRQRSAS